MHAQRATQICFCTRLYTNCRSEAKILFLRLHHHRHHRWTYRHQQHHRLLARVAVEKDTHPQSAARASFPRKMEGAGTPKGAPKAPPPAPNPPPPAAAHRPPVLTNAAIDLTLSDTEAEDQLEPWEQLPIFPVLCKNKPYDKNEKASLILGFKRPATQHPTDILFRAYAEGSTAVMEIFSVINGVTETSLRRMAATQLAKILCKLVLVLRESDRLRLTAGTSKHRLFDKPKDKNKYTNKTK